MKPSYGTAAYFPVAGLTTMGIHPATARDEDRHTPPRPIMVKVKDDLGGRLTSSGGVRKRLSAADTARLRHGVERAELILANAGARRIFKTWLLASHPGGTAKKNDLDYYLTLGWTF